MFSVIIPLFNKSAYIEKCLQSVFDQSYQDFEVIILNDGSTDNSAEKVQKLIDDFCEEKFEKLDDEEITISNKETEEQCFENPDLKQYIKTKTKYQDPKFKLINQLNSGVSIARNKGVSAAKYDFIAFLDADDWWDEHFLEEMRKLIEKFPEAVLYGSNYYYFKNRKSRLEGKGLPIGFSSGYIDYISLYASKFVVPINCSFVVVRKEAFLSEKGFKPSLKLGEDFDLWIRLALKHKVAYLNKTLAWSNQDSENQNRAIGNLRIYKPSENVIFNLDYISNKEKENRSLNILLDGLRVRLLVNYYLMGVYKEKVREELKKVDFSKQTFYYIFIYKGPRIMVRYLFKIRRFGSVVKQSTIGIFLPYNFGIHTKIKLHGKKSK